MFTLTKSAAVVAALLASGLWLTAGSAYANSSVTGSFIGYSRPPLRAKLPDLRVDANRDGVVDLIGNSDERLEDSQLALFLPNLDDDTRRCLLPENLVSLDDPAYDQKRAACNDAADDIVNGSVDERDMATIQALPMRDAPEGGRIAISGAPDGSVRLFIREGGQLRVFNPATENVPAQALRNGLDLRLEGRDIIRDTRWNGTVRVTLSLPDGQSDTVALRQAPLLLQHTLQTSNQVILGARPKLLSKEELAKDPSLFLNYEDYLKLQLPIIAAHKVFRGTLDTARLSAGVEKPLRQLPISNTDGWMQDMFEPAYMSVPGQDGSPHIIQVLLRSPDLGRPGSRVVFELRGRDVAVVQQAQDQFEYPPNVDGNLNRLGNLDAVPPYTAHGKRYPNGRMLIGSTDERQPDPSFQQMLAVQGAQPLLKIDTSWLAVGHVDEILQVVPANNRRGWTFAVPDPRFAVRLLLDAQAKGNGEATMFTGRPEGRFTDASAQRTINEVLANAELMANNEGAAQQLDRTLAALLNELGLDQKDLVRLPVLFKGLNFTPPPEDISTPPVDGLQASGNIRYSAYSPNLANGLLLSSKPSKQYDAETDERRDDGRWRDWVFAYTKPDGPVIDGKDIFHQAAIDALSRVGVRPFEIDAWTWAHIGAGEVHCTTNVLRDVSPDAAWWRKRN